MKRLMETNPWYRLRSHTAARIALGRVGNSLPTQEVLKFGLAHAQARDAVHCPLDVARLEVDLGQAGFACNRVRSQAGDRHTYLLRPDLGRRLNESDRARLKESTGSECVILIADGLSAIAVQRHTVPVLVGLRQYLVADWNRITLVIAEQGRVALGDDVGEALKARMAVVLIGERPGLSSPDSLGIYMTYGPQIGRLDSERNCISNVRPEGLPYADAAKGLAHLIHQSLLQGLSGVALKADSDVKASIENCSQPRT